ncbi:MAG: GNAT family N-acetyltransferase [Solobacterium sp.]|nr:GNAT family N-acetyltransferase [Solobacterium sp.]
MSEIRIVEKPDEISYDDLHELIYLSHAENRQNGFNVATAEMSGEELEAHIGKGGKCFVTMDGDKPVGMTAVRVRKNHYGPGQAVEQILVAVLPEYRRKGISTLMHEEVVRYARENRIPVIQVRTAANNKNMQKTCLSWGFQYIDFMSFSGIDHYTVVLMKWLDKEPSNLMGMKMRYYLKRLYVMAKYAPGKKKRF